MSPTRSLAPMWASLLLLALVGCGDEQKSPSATSGGASASGSGGNDTASSGSSSHAGSNAVTGGAHSTNGGTSTNSAGTSANGGSSPVTEGGGGTGAGPVATGPVTCRSKGDGKSTISFVNQCTAKLSFRGSDIEGGDLEPGEHACRDVGNTTTEIPAIRFWGFIGMDPGGEKYTLAELTLNTSFNDFDWYNISHVDASNLPMRVEPVDMPKCRVLTCAESLLPNCPAAGQLKDASGKVISCFSPNRDDPNSEVAQYFEKSCKDAYSWSGDDSESVAACAGEDYDVVFCP